MKRLGCLAFFVAFLLLIVLFAPNLLELHAKWLAWGDEPEPADAILVLGGGQGERLTLALRLYREGLAPRIFITGPSDPVIPEYSDSDGITQAEAKRLIAVDKGVPGDMVTVILGATSTYEEAEISADVFKNMGFRKILVATSPYHTRRARKTFRKVYEREGIDVLTLNGGWELSPYSYEHWWWRESDTFPVLLETAKLGYYLFRYGVSPI
jgi:uncharacterized SAM-binding protein YcdF (DUF218 family)